MSVAETRERRDAPWGSATWITEARIRWRCTRCGRHTEARLKHVEADDRGLIPVVHTCECGAIYRGSLSLDWVAPDGPARLEHGGES